MLHPGAGSFNIAAALGNTSYQNRSQICASPHLLPHWVVHRHSGAADAGVVPVGVLRLAALLPLQGLIPGLAEIIHLALQATLEA